MVGQRGVHFYVNSVLEENHCMAYLASLGSINTKYKQDGLKYFMKIRTLILFESRLIYFSLRLSFLAPIPRVPFH